MDHPLWLSLSAKSWSEAPGLMIDCSLLRLYKDEIQTNINIEIDEEIFVFNVCPRCGEHSVEKTIDPSGPYAVCPFCHHAHPFLQQPLFIITGPSGVGKTTICLKLVPLLKECVVMESDILSRSSMCSARLKSLLACC